MLIEIVTNLFQSNAGIDQEFTLVDPSSKEKHVLPISSEKVRIPLLR